MEEANTEIKKINANADARISEIEKIEGEKLKEAIERLDRQEISSAELESKKIILSKEKDILNKVFDTTLAGLENASREVKLAQYQAMVKIAKGIISNPKVLISPNDTFTAMDLGVESVDKDSRITAGIILQSNDKQVEVDMQYSTLLQSIWDCEIKSVFNILFG